MVTRTFRHAVVAGSLALLICGGVAAFASGDAEEHGWVVGSGAIQSEDRDVPAFTAVEVEGSGNVTIRQGSSQFVSVETDDNILPLVKTEVVGGVLHLGLVHGAHVMHMSRLEFSVAAPRVSGIRISGSGNARTASPLRTDSMKLDISGSGSIACDVDASSLEASIGGSGSITSRGHAEQVDVMIGGSGSVEARDLESANASVTINGSGSVTLYATATLTATINGSGSVFYAGGAKATVHRAGSGTVRAL